MKKLPEVVPLSAIIRELESGVSVNGEDRPAKSGESGVLKTSAVANGYFFPRENKAIHTAEVGRSKANIRKRDLLISRMNTPDLVGASGLVDADYPFLFLPDRLWRVVLADEKRDDIRWLSQLLNAPFIRAEIKVRSSGTSNSMKNLSQGAFLGIKVIRPQLEEQEKTVSILSLWDDAIRDTTQLIAAKTRLKRALMQQLLTGKLRFREFSSTRWKTYRLGELFAERVETNRLDLPLLSITANRGVVRRSDVEGKDNSSEDKRKYLRIVPGDIGYNTMRMWQGVSAVSRLEGIVSPAYTICIPNELIEANFAGYFFKYAPMVTIFHRHSQGMVLDTMNLKFSNFARIKVSIPARDEQIKIVETFRVLDHEIELLQNQLAALKQQKRGLMQKLLTGAVRVNASD